jgi:hypothetical protein
LPGQVALQRCSLRDLAVYGAGLCLGGFRLLPTEFRLSFDGFRTSLTCRLLWRNREAEWNSSLRRETRHCWRATVDSVNAPALSLMGRVLSARARQE